ncbi:MAG TPA: GNAT family N-acetyltransferase, partial [Dehalococcoidia bacterium]|nr:GNAT family N-acetyltransferase [Dehalococcoidia bacterium]
MPEYFLSGRLGFGQSTARTEVERDVADAFIRPEWTLCAFDDGVLASKMATLPLRVYWNTRVIPCGGVTAVTTLPSHRRRGHLRELMARSFCIMHDAGQPIAMLWASMAAIYQRFGYGMAFATHTCTFDARQLSFVEEVVHPGNLSIISNAEAAAVTSDAYERFAVRRTTALKRDDDWRARLTRELGRRG